MWCNVPSFDTHCLLVSIKSFSSWIRLLPRLLFHSIFPSITRFRRQFLCNMWSNQFSFLLYACIPTHTHTHTHIYIYIYMKRKCAEHNWISPESKNRTEYPTMEWTYLDKYKETDIIYCDRKNFKLGNTDVGLQVKEKTKVQKRIFERSCKDLQTTKSKKRSNGRKNAGNTNNFGENWKQYVEMLWIYI